MLVALFVTTVMLAVGFVLWPLVRQAVPTLPGGDPAGDTETELRLQQAALYEALRELEFSYQAGQYPSEDYQRLRLHYEQQAAAVLQTLDQHAPPVAVPGQASSRSQETARPQRRWLWQAAVACALVLVGLGWGVWFGRATSRPPDVPALLAAADAALERGDGPSALQQYRAVLEQEPENAAALTSLGLLAQQAGQAALGLRLIDRALQGQPRYLPAWQAKGVLHAAQGNDHEAIAAWETALRLLPDGDPHRHAIVALLAQARQRVQAAQTADAAPAEAALTTISGTIRLAAAPAPPLPAGAVLFIIARTDTGPPLAVKRVVHPQFPVHYTLGPEDVMVPGRAVTGQVQVSARVSASGTVGPVQSEDLVGHYASNPVAVGATDVDIVLTSRGTP
jgi:tetratricopeptide (TPR) repeat protein